MRRPTPSALAALGAFLAISLAFVATGASAEGLTFVRDGAAARTLDRAELAGLCEVRRISVEDAYHGAVMSYLACPLLDVLRKGFGIEAEALDARDIIFRARDGYARPSRGSLLRDPGAWLAFSDADLGNLETPAWKPIDRRQVDPGPFYVVWSNPGQNDSHRYPWPYQLVEIELTSFADRYPLTVPTGAEDGGAATEGYEIFKTECIACHAINGQGGKVGPDLNVPQSIVDYRPEPQIRQYIRNPVFFRYTTMPAHEHLSDAQLDSLLAYFRAMSRLRQDPGPDHP